MSFSGYATNPGTGGPSLAQQTYGGFSWLTSTLAYGPDSGAFNLVGINQPLPVSLGDGQKATYATSANGIVPVAAGATDCFELNNSAGTKVLRVTRVSVYGSAGTAVLVPVSLVKRTTLNTSGTSTTPTIAAFDSTDSAATGIVKAYTVNPTLGTSAGLVRTVLLNFPVSGSPVGYEWKFGLDASNRAVVLRANQSLCVSLNTTAITSGLFYIDICWCEE